MYMIKGYIHLLVGNILHGICSMYCWQFSAINFCWIELNYTPPYTHRCEISIILRDYVLWYTQSSWYLIVIPAVSVICLAMPFPSLTETNKPIHTHTGSRQQDLGNLVNVDTFKIRTTLIKLIVPCTKMIKTCVKHNRESTKGDVL